MGLCTLLAILFITLVGRPDLMVIPVFYINASKPTTREYIVGRRGQEKDSVQELCESRGGRPGLAVLTSLLVSVDVKLY